MRLRALVGLIVVYTIAGCGQAAPGATSGPGSAVAPGPTGGNPTPGPVATTGVPTDAPAGALPDPCTLFTQEEASVAVAAPLSAGVKEGVGRPEFGSGDQCSFTGTGEGAARVGVWPYPGDEIWQIYRGSFGPAPTVPGAEADDAITIGRTVCVVRKGDVIMEINLSAGDGYVTDMEPRLITLCQVATTRL